MANKNLKRRKSINLTPSFTELELIKFLQNLQSNSNKFGLGSLMLADTKAATAESFSSAGNAVGAIGGVASGALGIIGEAKKLATIDSSADLASIQNVANTDFTNLNSNTEALNAFYSRPTAQLSNLNKSGSEIAGGILQSGLAGAGAGAAFGPWGAIAGAAGGLISSGIGALVGNARANKEEERLKNEATAAENQQMMAFNNQLGNIESNKSRLALLNMAAYGGQFNSFPDGGNTLSVRPTKKETLSRDVLGGPKYNITYWPELDLGKMSIDHQMGNDSTIFISNNEGFTKVTPFPKGEEYTSKLSPQQIKEYKNKMEDMLRPNRDFGDGGKLYGDGGATHGGDWSNGLSFINSGGTHESNPNGGVQHSVDPQGVPNLVEEGEVIIDNFVYSNRLQIPASIQNKYKLKRMSFADAIKKLQKESEERPNDPISKAGLKVYAEELKQEQELAKERKKVRDMAKAVNSMSPQEKSELLMAAEQFAQLQLMAAQQEAMQAQQPQQGQEGQPSPEEMQMMQEQLMMQQLPQGMFALGGNIFAYEGQEEVKGAVDPIGTVAEAAGVTIPYANRGVANQYLDFQPTSDSEWHNLLFTDNKYNTYRPEYIEWHKTWKPSAEYIQKARAELKKLGWTDDVIDKRVAKNPDFYKNLAFDKKAGLMHVYAAQEFKKGTTPKIPETPGTPEEKPKTPEEKPKIPETVTPGEYESTDLRERQTISRYAPIAANALGLIMNNKDYTNADAIKQFKPTQVGFDPIGDYMTYKPMDTDYRANQLGQLNAATRSALINQAGGNRASAMAGILGADANYQVGLGELAREADLLNFENQARVKEFNRQTNLFNKEGAFRAQTANQGSDQLRYDQILKNAVMREAEDAAYNQTASLGLNNIANSLGAIGKENWMANIIDKNPYLLYSVEGKYKLRAKELDKKKDEKTTTTTSGPLVPPTLESSQSPGVPDRMRARAAEMAAMGLNINQFGVPLDKKASTANPQVATPFLQQGFPSMYVQPGASLEEGFAFGGKIKKRKKRK